MPEKAYGLIFTTEDAALMREGRKTQTRRVCPYQFAPMTVRRPHEGDLFYVRGNIWLKSYLHPAGWAKWKSPIFMSMLAARDFYRVTAMRVERLQKIPNTDIGCELGSCVCENGVGVRFCDICGLRILDETDFANLWDAINGKRAPWSSNPWVVVREFERVTDNV